MSFVETVVICGSMRFEERMRAAAVTESLAGRIVLMPLVNMRTPDPRWADPADAEKIKRELDRLHFNKIDRADFVLVVSDDERYIGDSTRVEIEYARMRNKPVRFYDND